MRFGRFDSDLRLQNLRQDPPDRPNDVATWCPFVWTKAGGIVNLGSLGGRVAVAYGINDAGTVIGVSQTADGKIRAFGWTAGIGIDDLGGRDNTANYPRAVKAS